MKILIFADFFYPGFKAGGPIQSIFNLANAISDDFNVYVVTRDRDSSEKTAYKGIIPNEWREVNNFQVLYLPPEKINIKNIKRILLKINPNIVYLNSFFSLFTVFTLIVHKLRKVGRTIFISVRGELFERALAIKRFKKQVYLTLFKNLLYNKKNTKFIATNTTEKNAIKKEVFSSVDIFVLSNIGRSQQNDFKERKITGLFKIVSISRIHRIKNLDFFAKILHNNTFEKKIIWDIYGFIEDVEYRDEILNIVNLNPNVEINVLGPFPNEILFKKIMDYDLFVHPSKSENFGHAIHDAILAGIPLIVGENTPWRNLVSFGIGYDLPFVDSEWSDTLKNYMNIDSYEMNRIRKTVYDYGSNLILESKEKYDYINLFKKQL